YGKTLRGVPELEPRWKRCVSWVDGNLGELLGKAFVAKYFPPAAKTHARAMIEQVQSAMAERLRVVPWMTDATKQKALEKLANMQNKIGYPDRWRDYSTLTVTRDNLVANTQSAAAFELRRVLKRIGTSVERGEWEMTPPTVNAYYDAQLNDMN